MKTQKMNIKSRILAVVMSALLVTALMPAWDADGRVYAAENSYEDQIKVLIDTILKNYKDEVTAEDLINGAYNGIVKSLDDPYSVFYENQEDKQGFVDNVAGEFTGIGVSLDNHEGSVRIVSAISGTPAERAGMKTGDIIVKVDGKDVTSLSASEVVTLVKGEAGTKVIISVLREGMPFDFTIAREVIKTDAVFYELMDNNIGYIVITEFDNDVQDEFAQAKEALLQQGAKGFIIDLRNNPGGYVTGATKIASHLMPAGPVMHFEQQGEIVQTVFANGNGYLGLPVVLVVNEGSASASEILAGALQDSGTAEIVGVTTYGKGVAQQIIELFDGTSMKLSSYYFLTPKKNEINGVGVKPDYYVENYSIAELQQRAVELSGFAPMTENTSYKSGEMGLNVYGAQQRLKFLGYDAAFTGTMDTQTVSAIKAFQKTQGLKEDGVLSVDLVKAIQTAAVKSVDGTQVDVDYQMEKALEVMKGKLAN